MKLVPETTITKLSSKIGILCWSCTEKHYEALAPLANWSYNYRVAPQEGYPV